MRIRAPYFSDKPEIDRIYKEFFSLNEYPDFFDRTKFPCPFVVTNDDDAVVVAGGVKNIAEVIVVSNQNFSPRVRLDALLQSLGSAVLIAKEMKHRQLHVFVNHDPKYVGILQRFGFKLLDAELLVLDLGEPHG